MPPEVRTLQIDRNEFQLSLEKKLADLPPLPAVVTQITRAVNDPNKGAEELSRLVSMDQGLCSKILRIVNSAYYGFPQRISTVTHAVMILGFNTVRNLVLGVSAFGMMPAKTAAVGLNRTQFWEHSVATAVAASVIARRKQPRGKNVMEEAFVAGLLHDFGKLYLDAYFPVQFAVCMAFANREQIPLIDAEKKVLGLPHTIVGKKIAAHWNFPPSLTAAISDHHYPVASADTFESAAIICAADHFAWQMGMGADKNGTPPEMPEQVVEWLNFNPEDYQAIEEEWTKQFAAAQDFIQVATAQAA